METGTLRFLLRQELFWGPRSLKRNGQRWMWFYLGVIVVLLGAVATVFRGFDPIYLAYSTFGLPYLAAMLMFSQLVREWKRGTIGWWLTLPYRRSRLLGAKYMASLVYLIGIILALYAGILLLAVYVTAIRGTGIAPILHLFRVYGVLTLLLTGVGPLFISLGGLIGAISRSRLKPLQILMWGVFGIGGNSLGWMTNIYTARHPLHPWLLNVPLWSTWAIPAMWVGAILLFVASAAVLDKHLDS